MTNRHKYADMIIAKAENMDLVVYVKVNDQFLGESSWGVATAQLNLGFTDEYKYFLCLPKHEIECLSWLNGQSVQDYFDNEWNDCCDNESTSDTSWAYEHMFMLEEATYRIKPRKEKRWVGVLGNGLVVDQHFEYQIELMNYAKKKYSESVVRPMVNHEIEVEVRV